MQGRLSSIIITVYKEGSLVAACEGGCRTGKLIVIHLKGDWSSLASFAATGAREVLEDKGGNGPGADLLLG